MYETFASTAHADLIAALSIHPQIKFSLLYSSNHVDFHCILVRRRGPTHPPRDLAFPFNWTVCDRVGVCSLLEMIGKSIAIIT